jgi:hypothetical protein
MNRNHFQQFADVRIDEASVLLAQGKNDGAYYPGKKDHHKRVTTERPPLRAGVAPGKDTERGS